jgi:hypothetical protein
MREEAVSLRIDASLAAEDRIGRERSKRHRDDQYSSGPVQDLEPTIRDGPGAMGGVTDGVRAGLAVHVRSLQETGGGGAGNPIIGRMNGGGPAPRTSLQQVHRRFFPREAIRVDVIGTCAGLKGSLETSGSSSANGQGGTADVDARNWART